MKIQLITPEIRQQKNQEKEPLAHDSEQDSVDLVYDLLRKDKLSEEEIDQLSMNVEHLQLQTSSINTDLKKITESVVDNQIDTDIAIIKVATPTKIIK